jgi:hypothetical protein
MELSWADWTRAAQGYITRNARYLDGVRKISFYTLLAAGAKRIKEDKLFPIVTDEPKKAPKIKEEDKMTAEKLNWALTHYFINSKSKVFSKQK